MAELTEEEIRKIVREEIIKYLKGLSTKYPILAWKKWPKPQ